MPMQNGGIVDMEAKLDRLLSLVSGLSEKVTELDRNVANQQTTISALSKNKGFKTANGHSTNKTTDVSKEERKRKQAIGAQVYSIYVTVFGILMVLSLMGKLPEFEFETSLYIAEYREISKWFRSTLYVPVIMTFVYVTVVFGGQRIMRDREPFDLKYPLALWSLALAIFSVWGSLRTVPAILQALYEVGLKESMCGDIRRYWCNGQSSAFWTWLFNLSKVPELIDSVFIVLRKKKLITLHWYHHITVMLFCWHASSTHSINGIFFSAMNFTVHAFMYMFYCFAALGYRPTPFAQSITVMQIAQMFAGTGITFYVAYHMTFVEYQDMIGNAFNLDWNFNAYVLYDNTTKCVMTPGNAFAGMAMYSSYLWLFCVFFYNAYMSPKPKSQITASKKVN